METLQAVISANTDRQRQALALNVRAGENLFPVLGRTELEAWLADRLGGARCVREIPNPDVLRLPPLDSEFVTLVLTENPDTIEVVGQTVTVTYRSGYAPSITLEGPAVTDQHIWKQLPDEGVKLPGGRPVIVQIKFGYYDTISDQSIPQLKVKVRTHLNQQQWDNWTDKPAIVLPTLDENASVAEIATTQYGTCVVDGTPLLAYGAVGLKGYRYYSSDPWFEAKWFRAREEAETEREKAVTKLEELKQQARDAKVLASVKAEAEAAKARLSEAYSAHGYSSDLGSDLRSRLYNRAYSYLPSDSAGLKAWTAESEALIAEVEAAVAAAQRKKEAEERQRQEEEARERKELAAILEAMGTEDLATARSAKDFAEAAVEIAGDDALYILQDELTAPYGYGRRQDAIRQNLPGIDDTDAGYRFFGYYRARDVDAMLAGAVAWLESQQPAETETNEDECPTEATDVSLADLAAKWGARIR